MSKFITFQDYLGKWVIINTQEISNIVWDKDQKCGTLYTTTGNEYSVLFTWLPAIAKKLSADEVENLTEDVDKYTMKYSMASAQTMRELDKVFNNAD